MKLNKNYYFIKKDISNKQFVKLKKRKNIEKKNFLYKNP